MNESKNQSKPKYNMEELYKRIIDNSYDALCLTDKDGRFVVANKATAESMGLPEAEILGRTPEDLMTEGVYGNSTIMEALKTKKTVAGIVTVLGKNLFSTSVPWLDEDGNVEFVLTNNRSDVVMDEFTRQLAYETEQHNRYHNIADYLSTANKSNIIYSSAKMGTVLQESASIAPSDSTVMLVGESGVGKELIAKFIHANSSRNDQAFIPVNCSAIPPELFESEFFGYAPGAFTGANSKGKSGLLKMAHKGTLFLDELGELPLLMQSKLLRFVESGEFYPVGSSKAENVDVRIITATNRNLLQMVQEKQFRNDLYYRLHVIPIHIPPLRERPEDIISISAYYLDKYNKKYQRHLVQTEKTTELLMQYNWPGNVRELRNVIERAVLMSPEGMSELSLQAALEQELDSNAVIQHSDEVSGTVFPSLELSLTDAMEQFERQYIQRVIDKHHGSLHEAADSLGVHRSTLYRKQRALEQHCR